MVPKREASVGSSMGLYHLSRYVGVNRVSMPELKKEAQHLVAAERETWTVTSFCVALARFTLRPTQIPTLSHSQ
jgi:hypothetical protein